MPQTVSLPQHMRAASVRANSFDESDNTIDVVFTTGADVLRCDWLDGEYIERLETGPDNVRLDRLNAGAAFLDTHNAFELAAMIGSVVPGSARMVSGDGLAKVKLSRAAGSADIVTNIRDGIITNVSVGYIVHAFTRTESSDGTPPIMIATDWEPVEISAVPVPADPGAQIRTAQRSAAGVEVHPCTITRAGGPGASQEGRMADKKSGTSGANDTETKPGTGDGGEVPPNPVNPKDNPDMVEKEVNPSPVDKVKGQPQVVDPGDAHPLPLSEAEQQRRIDMAVERRLADERDRSNGIVECAKRFGMRDLGDEHVRKGTKLQAFRDLVMDKLAEERREDGGPKFTGSAPEPSLREMHADDRSAGEAWARKALNRPAPAAR